MKRSLPVPLVLALLVLALGVAVEPLLEVTGAGMEVVVMAVALGGALGLAAAVGASMHSRHGDAVAWGWLALGPVVVCLFLTATGPAYALWSISGGGPVPCLSLGPACRLPTFASSTPFLFFALAGCLTLHGIWHESRATAGATGAHPHRRSK